MMLTYLMILFNESQLFDLVEDLTAAWILDRNTNGSDCLRAGQILLNCGMVGLQMNLPLNRNKSRFQGTGIVITV